MYTAFYGFGEKPFNITPDPKFVFLSDQHREALAHLLYGIRERGGFIEITGEIGTGKTTLCRTLLGQLDHDTRVALIFNPDLTATELLQSINEDLGIPIDGVSKKALVSALNAHLLRQREEKKNIVLIIDEAQDLQPSVLEQIRLLSNLETETEKLIQIVLMGQPELRKVLARPELEQLNQRITVRYHLGPLDRKETIQYLTHRLDVAGGANKVRFTPGALQTIHRRTGGVPRLINVLCDRCLLAGFSAGKKTISRAIVNRAMREIKGTPVREPRRPRRWVASGFAAASIALIAIVGYTLLGRESTLVTDELQQRIAVESIAPPAEADGLLSSPDILPPGEPAPGDLIMADEPILPAEGVDLTRQTELAPLHEAGETGRGDVEILPAAEAGPLEEVWTGNSIPFDPEAAREFIMGLDPEQSLKDSLQAISNRWGVETPLEALPADPVIDPLISFGSAIGLNHLAIQGNLGLLRLFDLPALLELNIPGADRPRYIALLEIVDQQGTFAPWLVKGEKVPTEFIGDFWFGRAFIFWKDFHNLPHFLGPGSAGEAVEWLQMNLIGLGYLEGNPTTVYDQETQGAIHSLQLANNIAGDGIVGPYTKIILYRMMEQFAMPSLSADESGEEEMGG